MLSSLSISNFALIKKSELFFDKGFNVILGQSGAGKSILIDALSFVLGGKADKSFIRTNEKMLKVDAVFDNISDVLKSQLEELGIDCEDELILSRSLNIDGKSVIRVNGSLVVLKTLKEITLNLIDFCGQHDSVGLLNVSNHLALLDRFIGNDVNILLSNIESLYDKVSEIDKNIARLGGNETERNRLKEILKFQISEIEQASLEIGEDDSLEERYKFISSAEKIVEKVGTVLQSIEQDADSVTGRLFEAKSLLSSLSDFPALSECRDRLESAYYEIKDVAEVLDDIVRNTDFDENELERLDKRLDLIKDLKRKYGNSIENILSFKEDIKNQLDELENSEFTINKLDKEKKDLTKQLEEKCEELSKLRHEYAIVLEDKLKDELADLQMKGTNFKVNFDRTSITKKGFDAVKFVFSANAGQDMRDLSKTASGGELSRLLLAFKNIMLDKENKLAVVFDEIDSGISGQTAGKVADKLNKISKYVQIICITHTPVVASKGDEFILVTKSLQNGETISNASVIEGDEIVSQIAALLDGSEIVSTTAIEHAKKLLGKEA